MNWRFWKKQKFENGLTLKEMAETFNLYVFEAQKLRSAQIAQALELDEKRDKNQYVR